MECAKADQLISGIGFQLFSFDPLINRNTNTDQLQDKSKLI
jgi:hypothetical protein